MATINSFVIGRPKRNYSKAFWGIIGISLVLLVLFQGPAQAFNLGLLTFSDTTPSKGEKVSTIATIDINSDERIDITRLELLVNGNLSKQCRFYPNASLISGCEGINISRLANNISYAQGYGYSYNTSEYGYRTGYSNGKLEYNLTFDTNYFIPDNYSIKLRAIINGVYFDSLIQNVLINSSSLSALNSSYYAGDNSTINSGLGILLVMNSSSSGNMTIANYSTNFLGNIPSGNISFEKFYEIDADSGIRENMSFTRINISYLDSQISLYGIDESSLRIYYYNLSSGIWEVYNSPYGGVDTENNVVWAITTHFSIFAVFGTAVSSSVVSPSGGGGSSGGGSSCVYSSKYNWNCSEWSGCTLGKQTRICNSKNNCGTTVGRPETQRVCTLLSQLFDIKFELKDSKIGTSNKLSSIIRFESFGNVPTPVGLTYRILNTNEDEVYVDKGEVIVTTEEIVVKNFENLDLPDGRYNLVLTTLYDGNITDEFRAEFVVGTTGFLPGSSDSWAFPIIIFGIIVAVVIVLTMIYFSNKKRKEDEEKIVLAKLNNGENHNGNNHNGNNHNGENHNADYARNSSINSLMGFNGV